MIIFGTGHRSEYAGHSFVEMVDRSWSELSKRHVDTIITGMASGFDLAFAIAALNLGIDIWCVRPWAGHGPTKRDGEYYEVIEKRAKMHTIVNPSLTYPGPWVYQVRNRFMVDHADSGIAFWNGKQSGGTFACLEYAKRMNKPVINIYPF